MIPYLPPDSQLKRKPGEKVFIDVYNLSYHEARIGKIDYNRKIDRGGAVYERSVWVDILNPRMSLNSGYYADWRTIPVAEQICLK